MYYQELGFNPEPPRIMHIDINSCFATIEQQANPLLRGKEVAVCAYTTPSGCILAASIEAKRKGVKTGMRVKEGKKLCPALITLNADPNKYRHVHKEMRKILAEYSNHFTPKSIDEFVLDMSEYVTYKKLPLTTIAQEIKDRIKSEVGEWISTSVGIGPNRFLAKLASNLKKPDGLEEINANNFLAVYMSVGLRDLHGINYRNEARLNRVGIRDPVDFYSASLEDLIGVFKEASGFYWYRRLRGWEIDSVEFARRTYGNSYALPHSDGNKEELIPIIAKLTSKTGMRLRRANYKAHGVHISLAFRDGTYWHKGQKLSRVIFDTKDIYKESIRLLGYCDEIKPVRVLAVNVFDLVSEDSVQLDLFSDVLKQESVVRSVDMINDSWGDFVVTSARFLNLKNEIHDRISFGGVKEI